jgi:ribonuclease HI
LGYVQEVKLVVDGGCRGNPGPGAIGVLVLDQDRNELEKCSECIGETTNNRAEYRALIRGLDLAARHTRKKVTVYSDSELLVKQMKGDWRLKNNELRRLYHQAKDLERPFEEVVYQRVGRTNQLVKKADRLLNEAFGGRSSP